MTMIEKAARAAAMGYGAKIVVVGGRLGRGGHTNAELAGYGQFGDSAERYSERHWEKFVLAVELALGAIRVPDEAMNSAFVDHRMGRAFWEAGIDAILGSGVSRETGTSGEGGKINTTPSGRQED